MSLIKDRDLIFSEVVNGNKTIYTLKNQNNTGSPTKLGDVFNHLPSGIIVKSETGMGATTVEIKALRNSIIVVPLRVIAATKHNEHGGFYAGTKPGSKATKAPSAKQIKEYLNSPGDKKLICVVDSLKKVMDSIPIQDRGSFFLLLDETDSLQLDSGFRPSMSDAMEVYKKHPANMRATVTATPLEFSDPELQHEPLTIVKYDTPNSTKVRLVQTNDFESGLELLIAEHFKRFPTEKLLVALNSVEAIESVRLKIQAAGIIKNANDVKILCSKKKAGLVGSYFHELDSNTLPGLLNFKTAAYFTGFDIEERYHLIVVCNPSITSLAISEYRFKQIVGRARKGLNSTTLLYQQTNGSAFTPNSIEELLDAANRLIKSIECLKHQFVSCPILGKRTLDNVKAILDTSRHLGRKLLFEDQTTGKFKVSYLNVDSISELNRLFTDVFDKPDSFEKALREAGFDVATENDTTLPASNKKKIISAWFDRSKLNVEVILNQYILDPKGYSFQEGQNSFETEVFQTFKEAAPYFDPVFLKSRIQKATEKLNGWKTGLANLRLELMFAAQKSSSNFEHVLNREFTIGESYSESELKGKWELLKASEGQTFSVLEDHPPIFFLNRIFETRKKNGKYRIKARCVPETNIKEYKAGVSAFQFDASLYQAETT
ncbi:hypothetical protein GCM10027454_00180 [Algoriphagus aestuariicola]